MVNWVDSTPVYDRMNQLRVEFDAFVESALLGMRKPDPAIYDVVLDALDTTAEETVFLDDSGHNLKPARAKGMTTIKVGEIGVALEELHAVLDVRGRFGTFDLDNDRIGSGSAP